MDNHFSRFIIFYKYFGSTFPICLMIQCVFIPIIFLVSFSTQGCHNHFVQVLYTRGSFGQNIVHLNTFLHSLSYCNNPPYLCFSFIPQWYACCCSCFICGTYLFMLTSGINNVKAFHLANKMCNFISTWIIFIHITSIRLSYT